MIEMARNAVNLKTEASEITACSSESVEFAVRKEKRISGNTVEMRKRAKQAVNLKTEASEITACSSKSVEFAVRKEK